MADYKFTTPLTAALIEELLLLVNTRKDDPRFTETLSLKLANIQAGAQNNEGGYLDDEAPGIGVYSGKTGSTLLFKKLIAGANVSLGYDAATDSIIISASGGGSAGVSSVNTKTGDVTIAAGTNVTITEGGSGEIVINAESGSGGGIQPSPSITFTVGASGADFTGIQEALLGLSQFFPVGGTVATLELQADYTYEGQVILESADLSWLTLTSINNPVQVNNAILVTDIGTQYAGRPSFPAIAGVRGAKLPKVDCDFQLIAGGTNTNRTIFLVANSGSHLEMPGKAITGHYIGVRLLDGATANLKGADLGGASYRGVWSEYSDFDISNGTAGSTNAGIYVTGGHAKAVSADLSGGGQAVYANLGAVVIANNANMSGSGFTAVYAESQAKVYCASANASAAGAGSAYGFYADTGAEIYAGASNIDGVGISAYAGYAAKVLIQGDGLGGTGTPTNLAAQVDRGGVVVAPFTTGNLSQPAGIVTDKGLIIREDGKVALHDRGNWDASTNTPALPVAPSSSNGQLGAYYVVTAAGTQFGINFEVGDWLVAIGTQWGKINNQSGGTGVTDVNGLNGSVEVVGGNAISVSIAIGGEGDVLLIAFDGDKSTVGLGNVDNTSDMDKPVSTAQQTALDGKVDKEPGKGLSDTNYTQAEKDKLAGLEGSHYRGQFTSLAALEAAVTDAVPGDYADVDAGVGSTVVRYVWDSNDDIWTAQVGESTQLTGAQIKSLYEAQPDTNAYTDAEKSKLGALPTATELNTSLAGKVDTSDARLSDAREWTAATVDQAEAEAGTATTRRAWTAQRVRQAILGWWNGSTDKTKLDGLNKTTSPTDTTAGRLLQVGDGGALITPSLASAFANNANNVNINCILSTGSQWEGSPFSGLSGNNQGYLKTSQWVNSAYLMQEFFNVNVSWVKFTRRKDNNIWSEWVPDYNARNILGTVSQSGGVPTGAIIQRGSNANGEYTLLADGTGIATRIYTLSTTQAANTALAGGFRTGAVSGISLPFSFANTSFSVLAKRVSGDSCFDLTGAPSTTNTIVLVYSRVTSGNVDTGVQASILAVGRWFS